MKSYLKNLLGITTIATLLVATQASCNISLTPWDLRIKNNTPHTAVTTVRYLLCNPNTVTIQPRRSVYVDAKSCSVTEVSGYLLPTTGTGQKIDLPPLKIGVDRDFKVGIRLNKETGTYEFVKRSKP